MEHKIIVPQKVSYIDGAFTAAECQELIERAEREGYGRGSDEPNSADQRDRSIWYDTVLADRIFNLVSSTPNVIVSEMKNGRTPARVLDKIRLYKYGTGDSFKPHVDGGHVERRAGPHQGESSVYTYVLYLNDGSNKENGKAQDTNASTTANKKQGKFNNLEGGGTKFFSVPEWPQDVPTEIEAKTGRLLIFKQKDMVHEGCRIIQGHKFILQGMILYTPEKGKNGLPISNIFTVVNQETTQNPIELLKSLKPKSTIVDADSESEYDRLVRMVKAGHPVEVIERFVFLAGVPTSQSFAVSQQIVADAEESQKNRQVTDDDSTVEDTPVAKGDSYLHCRFYKMLKAGLTPDQVYQSMIVVSKLPAESARAYLNSLVARIE
eukprot:TRINITY_DN9919_c0_g1_i1.p1 TRINITY_DN9919_c0_g1~~TRINITY_DN9919_c0_g1_i1.p1  ORF type:complete len:379 (+),score=94.08 TRINITY_DN9919_c0_g1_i1:217-1353(+)